MINGINYNYNTYVNHEQAPTEKAAREHITDTINAIIAGDTLPRTTKNELKYQVATNGIQRVVSSTLVLCKQAEDIANEESEDIFTPQQAVAILAAIYRAQGTRRVSVISKLKNDNIEMQKKLELELAITTARAENAEKERDAQYSGRQLALRLFVAVFVTLMFAQFLGYGSSS